MINLEPLCAKYGHRMIRPSGIKISEQENVITKALGVLTENGIYAMCINLLSCNKKKYGKSILIEDLQALWRENQLNLIHGRQPVTNNPAVLLEQVRNIAENLPHLILAKRVTEQALTFARYHAKADIAMQPAGGN